METSATASPARNTTNAGKLADSKALPSLLVIDDDPVHRMVISKVGEKAGYAITSVGSIDDAMVKIKQKKYDCISLDLSLEGKNGALLINDIAEHNRDAMLIVISGATAATREDTLVHALKLRLNVVEAPKPVDLADLRGKLQLHAAVHKP
jgi:two-component system chemotaxis response regulator CheY